jgi:hypothetical protein
MPHSSVRAALTALALAVVLAIVARAGGTLAACLPMLSAPTARHHRDCTLARDSLLRAVDDGAAALGNADVSAWVDGLLRARAGGPRPCR